MRLLRIPGRNGASSLGVPLDYQLRESARKKDCKLRFLITLCFLFRIEECCIWREVGRLEAR